MQCDFSIHKVIFGSRGLILIPNRWPSWIDEEGEMYPDFNKLCPCVQDILISSMSLM